MANKRPTIIIPKVIALHPRIDKTYHWVKHSDGSEENVPCKPTDNKAAYTLDLVMTAEQVKPLYLDMKAEYEDKKKDDWDAYPPAKEVFKAGSEFGYDGMYVAKTRLVGAWDDGTTTEIQQFDANNVLLKDGFQLTQDSKINVQVSLVAYKPNNISGHGLSLRLRQVQVEKLAAMSTKASSFKVVEGGFNSSDSAFVTTLAPSSTAAVDTDDIGLDDDPVSPPKSVAAAPAKEVVSDEILDELDSLNFDDPTKVA